MSDEAEYDVVICGSGSAGLAAATWLAQYDVRCKVLERRPGPMEAGQADGVQCRTVEVFESFGLADELLREAYHVMEDVFWAADADTPLRRTRTTADTEPGLSHQPHLILNQARINAFLIGAIKRFGGEDISYGHDIKNVLVDPNSAHDLDSHCVEVTTVRNGKEEKYRAKYVLGCDGAHSAVRKSLGFKMVGDSTNSLWGVMDTYPQTNFPDIRKKCLFHTPSGGLIVIPREGGSLSRFYIEMPSGSTSKEVELEDLQNTARRILSPYELDFGGTFWWSAYSIGQRLADHFHQDYRVFLTGDACHTHSPKAGQGMNVSLQDGYNIGWKLGQVLTGQSKPDLLKTYVLERQAVATELIEFDRNWTKMFSKKEKEKYSPEYFSDQFVKNARYCAGLTARYEDSMITSYSDKQKANDQLLSTKLVVGMRFPSTQVVRFCDAKAMQLARALPADGRWRVLIFAGNINDSDTAIKLNKIADYLEHMCRTYTPVDADIDSFIEPILVLAGPRKEVEQEQIPAYFWPTTGKWKMRDLHKTYVDDESYNSGHGHAYEFYGVDVKRGAVVVVRPDQYVSKVASPEDHEAISDFFKGFAVPRGSAPAFSTTVNGS